MKKNVLPGKPAFSEALRFWFKLGWISFGGTAGHIALMHDYLVERRQWISNSRFFHALSLCMLLPGPEAQQLAIYIGWKLHGKKGGIAAGVLFVLPSMLILLALSIVYVRYGQRLWITALFDGLKPAVIALIATALFRVARRALIGPLHYGVAVVALVCIFFYNVPLPVLIAGAIVLGLLLRYVRPSILQARGGAGGPDAGEGIFEEGSAEEAGGPGPGREEGKSGPGRLVREIAGFLLLWGMPLLLFRLSMGEFVFWKMLTLFWTQAALFTIGGSYTVLPYVAQIAVGKLHWLTKLQMVDGFALAETTPGPLIIVVAFVGFLAGYHHFHDSIPMGSIALLVTTYYTFLPCFFYIFTGGPLIERTHGNAVITSVLGVVTAAIVGVIFHLTLFLGRAVLFPDGAAPGHPDVLALGWMGVCLVLQLRWRMNVLWLIGLSLAFGLVRYWCSGGLL